MFGDGSLTFQEFATREPLPLATIQDALLAFLRDRKDTVLVGAHAVNAYVREARMSQDVDIVTTRANQVATEARAFLKNRFQIALRLSQIAQGRAFRLYHARKSQTRHLFHVFAVHELPPARPIRRVLVAMPVVLIAAKVMSYTQRQSQAKAGTDWRDIALLLLYFPEFKSPKGPVLDRLKAEGVGQDVIAAWNELVAQVIEPEDDDEKFVR